MAVLSIIFLDGAHGVTAFSSLIIDAMLLRDVVVDGDGSLDEPAVSRLGLLQVFVNRVSFRLSTINSENNCFPVPWHLSVVHGQYDIPPPWSYLTFYRYECGVPSATINLTPIMIVNIFLFYVVQNDVCTWVRHRDRTHSTRQKPTCQPAAPTPDSRPRDPGIRTSELRDLHWITGPSTTC